MKIKSLLIFISLFVQLVHAQKNEEVSKKAYSPTIGIGVGVVGFYGDLNDDDYGSPFTANPGFNVFLIQKLTDYLDVRFSFLISQVREEERSIERNINFESDIRTGAMLLEYNFDHFLPEKRIITPFISTGISVSEFNPKTDLEAFGGERYNYWSDGTIRNVSENSADADQSLIVLRDYTYETDIREAGFNNSVIYSERAIAIPLGIGAIFHLNDQFDFRLESKAYFSFSDYFDGITPETKAEFVGSKKGNSRNDFFIYNGFGLSYNFQKVDPAEDFERIDRDNNRLDFLASGNTEDFDQDGVIDLVDLCPNTPSSVVVDTSGCPVDTDGDGVPDFKDKEVNSEYPEFANDDGVSMTNDMIYVSYLNYIDSTLELAEVVERSFSANKRRTIPTSYRVKVGEYPKGETPGNMGDLLSLSDLNKIDQGDKTLYTAGSYKTLPEAVKRAVQLEEQGFGNTEVLKRNKNGAFTKVSMLQNSNSANTNQVNTRTNTATESSEEKPPTNIPDNTDEEEETEISEEVVFRVQLGAFKNKPTGEQFKNIPSLFVVQAGGYYRYMSGSFTDFNSAAKHKVKMVVEGYKGAFVVAYKNGKKVPLKSVGVKPISSDPLIGK